VTQVTGKTKGRWMLAVLLLAGASRCALGQSLQGALPASSAQPFSPGPDRKPAEELYLKLQGVGLDPARTYHIRGASLDRPALHVLLEDGEISFTSDVAGRITGAFFEGDGELLLTPPNQVERASMVLFTGMAILEERFTTAYLRFNDEIFAELQPYFRPAEDAEAFSSRWNETAQKLAEQDALRLLSTFSRGLPNSDAPSDAVVNQFRPIDSSDLLLHVRVQGQKLGTFDVYFDTKGVEQVWAGQARAVEGITFYDLWTSFTPTAAAAGRIGEKRSENRNDEVTTSRYRIRAEVKPPTTLTAEAFLQMEVRQGGERTLYFELSRFLQVKEVDFNGRPVEFINNPAIDGTQLARRGNDLVAVVFPEALRQGQTLELKFVYGGDVLSEAGGGLLYVGARGTWYPNRGLFMSDFDLEFRYPPGWTLVATGKKVAPEIGNAASDNAATPLPPGEQVGRWVTERPSQLAGFNLGRYERAAAARAGEVTVEAYAARSMEKSFPRPTGTLVSPPDTRLPRATADPVARQPAVPSPARNAQAVADHGARAVEFFSQRFGPYPYSSLALTQMPGRTSQGWPGLVFLSSFAFLTPEESADLSASPLESALNRLTLPHETAHQWWGDLVGWRTYRDQWMFEALANYCALMTMEAEKPAEVRTILERYRDDLLERNKNGEFLHDAGPVTLGLRLNSSHFPNGYEAVSYGRGTWLFHMLRHMLLDAEAKQLGSAGHPQSETDEPLVRALRKVRERYAGKSISTRELFAVFEEDLPRSLWYEGHKSLDWFIQSWVEGVAVPHYSAANVKFLSKAAGSEVTGTILQKEAPPDMVSAVPVYAVSAAKSLLLGTVLVDGPETLFHFAVPPGTKKIVLDPQRTLLTNPK
jgi:hypothetical protein